ncbi:hypothetical protein A8F94_08910 [Bacillus sp. FJAT-27225]|uniref:hypothetical protein n=1 Tax=Bacillus sp. FJAT-27225 TaxID=1743144 RepID=UPI00080C2FF3|nr:hypothetical protein [Bacillus sp. FJAT-27225]OCA87937.1 hypothetical protein A8F94_08910 [Bacillus sp. FJAT-27225]
MEKRLKEAKERMFKDELANWEFSAEMKQNVMQSIRSGEKRTPFSKKLLPSLLSVALVMMVFGGLYQYVVMPGLKNSNVIQPGGGNPGLETAEDEPDQVEPSDKEEIPSGETEEEPDKSPVVVTPDDNDSSVPDAVPAPDLMELLVKFDKALDAIVETAIEPDFKLPGFKTKQELYEHLGDHAVLDVLERNLEHHFKEKPDGLYLLPQEGPLYIVPSAPYKTVKLTETSYRFTQVTDSDMHGDDYMVEVWFEYIDGKWLITWWERSTPGEHR